MVWIMLDGIRNKLHILKELVVSEPEKAMNIIKVMVKGHWLERFLAIDALSLLYRKHKYFADSILSVLSRLIDDFDGLVATTALETTLHILLDLLEYDPMEMMGYEEVLLKLFSHRRCVDMMLKILKYKENLEKTVVGLAYITYRFYMEYLPKNKVIRRNIGYLLKQINTILLSCDHQRVLSEVSKFLWISSDFGDVLEEFFRDCDEARNTLYEILRRAPNRVTLDDILESGIPITLIGKVFSETFSEVVLRALEHFFYEAPESIRLDIVKAIGDIFEYSNNE